MMASGRELGAARVLEGVRWHCASGDYPEAASCAAFLLSEVLMARIQAHLHLMKMMTRSLTSSVC